MLGYAGEGIPGMSGVIDRITASALTVRPFALTRQGE
jgi:hypothetical protein